MPAAHMQSPIIITTLLCCLLLGCHLYHGTLVPRRATVSVMHQHAYARPVLTVLHEAAANTLSTQEPDPAIHDQQFCRISIMNRVLHAAAGLQQALLPTEAASNPQQAQELLVAFRARLAATWAADLQHIVVQHTQTASNSSSSSSRCRSVQMLARQQRSSPNSTALLLVLNSWSRLAGQLQLNSPSLLMLWHYAKLHGYGLHVYVHGADLPPWMPVYFIKTAGILHSMQDLDYQHVMYLDWDVLLSPYTAPPLTLFYNEYPAASLLLQGEFNFCAGVNLWRSTPQARAFLQAWWELGARGCCPTTQHDQSALKHLIAAYLSNFTATPSLYGARAHQHFKLPAALPPPAAQKGGGFAVQTTEPPGTAVSTWLQLRPLLQQQASAIGLVGLDVHYRQQPGRAPVKLALHNCMGMWWGCVPPDTPALIYHTGHGRMEKLQPSWMAQRVLVNLLDWLTLYPQPQNSI